MFGYHDVYFQTISRDLAITCNRLEARGFAILGFCSLLGVQGVADVALGMRTLTGLCKNPNVAAVLLIGLGCEFIKAPGIRDAAAATGKPVEYLNIQDEGGSVKTTKKGVDIAKNFLTEAEKIKKTECG